RIIEPELMRALADARLERRARSEALDAIAVEWAGTGEVIARKPRDADMAELAMGEAARRLAVDDEADANSGADSDVGEILHPLPRAPAHLGEGGAVDVGVERGRNVRGALQAAKHVGAAPAGLRSAGDLAVVSR